MTTTLPDEQPYCLHRLGKRIENINGDVISAPESRRLLVDLAGCFLEVAHLVGKIQHEQTSIVESQKIKEEEIVRLQKEKDSDWMKTFLCWFTDKVLPSLLTAAVVSIVVWLAAVNGHLAAP